MKIDVGDVRLFVDVDGAEYVPRGAEMVRRPTVLLLHGGPGMDHSSFKTELDSLREIAQLVYVDHRGNGRSEDGPRERWTLAQWGDDVRAVCDALGIEKPIVFGQSFGGFVAQSYAVRHPDHPAGVIFSSTSGKKNQARNLAVFERLGGAEAREAAEAFYADPGRDTIGRFLKHAMVHYNRHFSDPDGMKRTVLRLDVLSTTSSRTSITTGTCCRSWRRCAAPRSCSAARTTRQRRSKTRKRSPRPCRPTSSHSTASRTAATGRTATSRSRRSR